MRPSPPGSPDTRVHFDLFAPEGWAEEMGCPHLRDLFPASCRNCAISMAAYELVDAGRLAMVSIQHHEPHPEHRVRGVTVRGSHASDDDGARMVVTRMLALLHGHPDPLEWADART